MLPQLGLKVLIFEGDQQLPFSDFVPLAHVPSLNLAGDQRNHLDFGGFYLSLNHQGRLVTTPASGQAEESNNQNRSADECRGFDCALIGWMRSCVPGLVKVRYHLHKHFLLAINRQAQAGGQRRGEGS